MRGKSDLRFVVRYSLFFQSNSLFHNEQRTANREQLLNYFAALICQYALFHAKKTKQGAACFNFNNVSPSISLNLYFPLLPNNSRQSFTTNLKSKQLDIRNKCLINIAAAEKSDYLYSSCFLIDRQDVYQVSLPSHILIRSSKLCLENFFMRSLFLV